MADLGPGAAAPGNPRGGAGRGVRPEPRHIRRVLVIWAIATVLGIALVLNLHRLLPGLLPPMASSEAQGVDFTLGFFTVLAVPVAMLVWVFAAYSIATWRVRRFEGLDGPPISGSPVLQTTWILSSALLCLFLVVYGLALLTNVSAAPPGRLLTVDVTGQQWQWNFKYPSRGGVTTTTLALPVNRPILFRVTSLDVDHSFWIPALAIKIDAIPGEVTTVYAMPTREGTYTARCAELCGLYHSYMQSRVRVLSAGGFSSWIGAQERVWGRGGG